MTSLRRPFIIPLMAGIALLLLTAAAAASGLDDSRRKLAEIERRITQATKNLEAKRTAEQSLVEDLKTVENELSNLGSRMAEQKRRVAALETEIAARGAEAETTRRSIAATEVKVRKRLAAIYKSGETGPGRMLFSAESPSRMAEGYDFLGRIVRRDRELLATYRRQNEELHKTLALLTTLRRQQQDALSALSEERKTARQALLLKEDLLVQVRQDRQALAGMLAELKERAARLSDLVKKLESEKPREYTEKSSLFATRKGRLPWPVEGAIRVGFGTGRHPELGTMYDSQGIEIAAARETPIKAVGSGRVIFANWFKGYGNLLIVDHGESYYSLYAQASRLARKVGDPVTEGDLLGYSGLAGSEGIYFEIRRGGAPLDPTAWLKPR